MLNADPTDPTQLRKAEDQSQLWPTINRVGAILAITAAVGTLIGLWVQLPRIPEVHVLVLGAERLWPTLTVPGLEYQVAYNGERVDHPWKLRIRLVNTGQQTIVAAGPHTNLIHDKMIIGLTSGTRVLNITQETASFPHALVVNELGQLELRFAQWRQREDAVYSLYVSTSEVDRVPGLVISERDIIDGEVRVIGTSAQAVRAAAPLLDRTPKVVATVGRFTGLLLSAGVAGLAIVLTVVELREWIRVARWAAQHRTAISESIERDALLDEEERRRYQVHPWKYPGTLADNIPAPPDRFPMVSSWLGAIAFTVSAMIVLLGAFAQMAGIVVW
ncbi:MAG: hypothetical protein ACHQ9S_17015 [Candidatus Binatia bacterium]